MLALYRKYRPRTLSEVVGQPQVTTPLSAALKSKKFSHSYLFTGPRGCGKTSVARILAHELNNFPYELEDSYLDIIEIDAASNTGVDNIRDLREKAMIAPSKGKYKVYIIDEVHMLSKSAFNALLKTLEEPPAHVIFILATTDLEKVPITITSRSQVFTFRLASEQEMLPHLKDICKKEKINIEDNALEILISRGGGSFRDTLSILDQISTLSSNSAPITEILVASVLGLPLDSKLSDLLSAYASGDFVAVSAQLKSLLQEGLKPELIAESTLKKIISRPSPEFLPLLGSLPSVSAPFPEAKLLLAFLADCHENNNNTNKRTGNSDFYPSTHKEDSPNFQGASGEIGSFRDRPQITIEEEAPKPRNDGSEGRRVSEGTIDRKRANENSATATELNVSSFLSTIKSINPAISQQLSKCKLVERSGVLHIYPTQKITHTILSRKQNSEILLENLPEGIELIVHPLEDLTSDPEVSKIADIMGGAQPLSDSDSPF